MTVEEHFLLMILLEFAIFFIGIGIIALQQRKQTKLIEDIIYNPDYAAAVAENAIFGFMDKINPYGKEGDELKEVQQKQAIFFGFTATVIQRALSAPTHTDSDGNPVYAPIPIETGSKFWNSIANQPEIRGYIKSKIKERVGGEVRGRIDGKLKGWGL